MATQPDYAPDPIGKAPVNIPDGYNSEWIPEDHAKGDTGVAAVREWLGNAQAALVRHNDVRTKPDLANTRRAHETAIIANADGELDDTFGDRFEAAEAAIANSRTAAQAALEAARGLKDDPTYGPAIALAFKSMTPNERLNEAQAAMARGDKRTLGALLSAPPVATGFRYEEVEMLQAEYDRRFCKAELARLAIIDGAANRLMAAQGFNLKKLTEAYGGTDKEAAAWNTYRTVRASYGFVD